MCFPAPSIVLLLGPPATRPVYDIPPVITRAPHGKRLRALAARLTRGRRRALDGVPDAEPRGSHAIATGCRLTLDAADLRHVSGAHSSEPRARRRDAALHRRSRRR